MIARGQLLAVGAALTVAVLTALTFHPVRSLLLGVLPPTWRISLSAWKHGVRVDHSVRIQMPDGIVLAASLYLPRSSAGRLPAIVVRLPYHRLRYGEGYDAGVFFASRGYAVVVQDLRGTGDSGGELLPWKDAGSDGEATLDWITLQTWSNGKVGTFGCSALGETQFVLAARNHPAHAAMIPSGAGGAVGSAANRYSYFGVFEGGIFQLASGVGWFMHNGSREPTAPPPTQHRPMELLKELPVADLVTRVRPAPNGYTDFLSAPLADPRWLEWGFLSDRDHSRVPALVINTWGDQTVGDTLALAEQWRRRGTPQKVVIAHGTHCGHGSGASSLREFGELEIENAERPWNQWYLDWFAYWLRGEGTGLRELDNYTVFMLVANAWVTSESWPPKDAVLQRWHLGSRGQANSRAGDGWLSRQTKVAAAEDVFRYDPHDPVPSRGGPLCCTGDPSDMTGPVDQADVEVRDDVLVYTSDELPEDLRIVGPLTAHLTLSSEVPDTDIVARLVHVWPDGRSTNIQEGALRLRYRDGFDAPVLMKPGERYVVEVDMRSIAYLLPKGHRLRLHVTSSSFPRLERNLNTGAASNAHEANSRIATTRIHYSSDEASYVQMYALPVRSGASEDVSPD
jgi:putative CocE/NonD family hydrolase